MANEDWNTFGDADTAEIPYDEEGASIDDVVEDPSEDEEEHNRPHDFTEDDRVRVKEDAGIREKLEGKRGVVDFVDDADDTLLVEFNDSTFGKIWLTYDKLEHAPTFEEGDPVHIHEDHHKFGGEAGTVMECDDAGRARVEVDVGDDGRMWWFKEGYLEHKDEDRKEEGDSDGRAKYEEGDVVRCKRSICGCPLERGDVCRVTNGGVHMVTIEHNEKGAWEANVTGIELTEIQEGDRVRVTEDRDDITLMDAEGKRGLVTDVYTDRVFVDVERDEGDVYNYYFRWDQIEKIEGGKDAISKGEHSIRKMLGALRSAAEYARNAVDDMPSCPERPVIRDTAQRLDNIADSIRNDMLDDDDP